MNLLKCKHSNTQTHPHTLCVLIIIGVFLRKVQLLFLPQEIKEKRVIQNTSSPSLLDKSLLCYASIKVSSSTNNCWTTCLPFSWLPRVVLLLLTTNLSLSCTSNKNLTLLPPLRWLHTHTQSFRHQILEILSISTELLLPHSPTIPSFTGNPILKPFREIVSSTTPHYFSSK